MPKIEDMKKEITKAPGLVPGERLNQLLERVDIRKKFEDMLGSKAPGFISSILSLTNANSALKTSDPMSIISSAAIAATLDLPVNPNLGFAHIVPYSGIAQFQMGWKGFVQLAIRTGLYKTMNAAEIYEGELVTYNRITGETMIDESQRKSDKIVAYAAYFRLTTGFEKYLLMTVEQVTNHAKRYSKSFSRTNSPWQNNFEAMALKTVLKLLLSKYGVLSIELQKAIEFDQAASRSIPDKDGAFDVTYPDNDDTPVGASGLTQEQIEALSGTAIEP